MSRADKWIIAGILLLAALLFFGQGIFGGAPWLK